MLIFDIFIHCYCCICCERYGDLKPGSTNERIFTALYVIFGIFILSAAVTAVSTAIYGRYNAAVEERFARMALRMREERIRHSDSIDIDTHIETTTNYGSNVDKEHRSMQQDHILKFLDMNEHSRIDGAESEQEAASLSFRQRVLSKVDGITATIIPPISKNLQHQRDKEVLETLQALNLSIFDEDLQEMRVNIIRTFGLIVLVMLIGWISMLLIEDWNFGDSFYWSVVTITTVGFGDIVPNSDGGKVFTIFYGLVGCAVLAHGMNTLVAYPLTKKSKQSELRVMMQFGGELTEMTLQEIMCNDLFERIPNLRNDKNSISRSEFILLMLSLMNKTYEKDLMIISSIFDVLDKNKIGVLSADALIQQKAH